MTSIAIPMNLTKSTKKKGGVNKAVMSGFEDVATRVKERARQMDALKAEQEIDTAELVAEARAFRIAEECAGNFAKTVDVPTEQGDGDKVQVVFSDRYTGIDPEHEPVLRVALGRHFDGVLKLTATAKPRSDLTVEKLQAVLGDKYEAFCSLFEVSEQYTPVAAFMETRANLRPTLTSAVNEALDVIVERVQYKPSIKTK